MRKQNPTIEWVVTESDAEWESLRTPSASPNEPPPEHQRYRQHILWGAGVLILLLTGVGRWVLPTDQPGRPQTLTTAEAVRQTEVGTEQALPDGLITNRVDEQTPADWQRQYALENDTLRSTLLSDDPGNQLIMNYSLIAQQGDQVMLNVVITNNYRSQTLRQTRFYRRTPSAWLRIAPIAELWGPTHTLATSSFVFSFGEKDRQTVTAVAPELEAIYATILRNFGLPSTTDRGKFGIDVSVTQHPGIALIQGPLDRAFRVPSPALYLAPAKLTDAQILLQAIVLQLLDHLLAQATATHNFDPAWQPLRKGLALWQLWALDLPLAVWREEVVQWLYHDAPMRASTQVARLPMRYGALCMTHTVWMAQPTQIGVPFWCHGLDRKKLASLWWQQYDPPTHLAQLATPLIPNAYKEPERVTDLVTYPGQTVVLATLSEYALATYGRERVPALMTGLGQYQSWETLIPAVYGVSVAEFEAGWQAYLAARYGVSLDTVGRQK